MKLPPVIATVRQIPMLLFNLWNFSDHWIIQEFFLYITATISYCLCCVCTTLQEGSVRFRCNLGYLLTLWSSFAECKYLSLLVLIKFNNKNFAIANRSRVSCACTQYVEGSLGINITP